MATAKLFCVVREVGRVTQWRPVEDLIVLNKGERVGEGIFELETLRASDGGPSCAVHILVGWPQGELKIHTLTDPDARKAGDIQLPAYQPNKYSAPCYPRVPASLNG